MACVEGSLVFIVVLLSGKLTRLYSDADGGAKRPVTDIFGGLGVTRERGYSARWISARRAQQRTQIISALESRRKIKTGSDREGMRIKHHVKSEIRQLAVCLLKRSIVDRRQRCLLCRSPGMTLRERIEMTRRVARYTISKGRRL